jgi:hypothetical protein
MKPSRRSNRGMVLAGAVVIAAGFAIAIVEAMRLPKFSIWVVVGVTVIVVALIRALTRTR